MKSKFTRPLPPEVRAGLSEAELSDFRTIWQEAEGYYGPEPSLDEFRTMGQEIWPALDLASRPRLRKVWLRRATALAACVAILLAVGITILNQGITVEAPEGTPQYTHLLPDGTTLNLNSGTRIRYNKKFGTTNRDIRLIRGEVFFDVIESDLPFEVQTFNLRSEVIGTSFNIRAWPDELNAATDVLVKTGRVLVIPREAPQARRSLQAGQSARLRQGSRELAVTNPESEAVEQSLWTEGSFKFTNWALGDVMAEIERRYDVDISIESPTLNALPIGILKESPESAEEIIRGICALHCEYRVVPGGFEITER